MELNFTELMVVILVIPISTFMAFLTLYWFWKANKIIVGKLRGFFIWIIITIIGFFGDGISVYLYNVLGLVTGTIWILVGSLFSLITIIGFLGSAYQLKKLFK